MAIKAARARRPTNPQAKATGRFDCKLAPKEKALIYRAAKKSGVSASVFVVGAATEKAQHVLGQPKAAE